MRQYAILVVFTILIILGAACESGAPCDEGTDVRLLDDSGVPKWLKDEILYKPEPMIATQWLPAPDAPLQPSGLYPTGKIVVIRVATADWPVNSAATKDYVDTIMFGDDPFEQSIYGYYSKNSYGQFKVSNGGIPSWITLSNNLSDYAGGDIEGAGATSFMKDVLESASVNWPQLDTDDDLALSRAEAQIIVLIPNAMPGTGFASVRYPAIGSVATPQGTIDFGKRPIVYFSLKAAADPNFDDNPIRVLPAVAHELAHGFFNLPDRYGANTGTGNYDIMSNNNAWTMMTMHDRMNIGWIQPKIVSGHRGECLQFVVSDLQAAALVLVVPEAVQSPLKPLEYWVLENRTKGFTDGDYDSALPDEGLAIWYVAEGTYSSGHNDVRLVDFSKPDQDPDLYASPGGSALFKVDASDPKRLLLNRNGEWSLLWFQNTSAPGLFMYSEF